MVTSFKKLSLLVLSLALTLCTFAQRGGGSTPPSRPPITFQITHIDSLVVDFSWATPPLATSCEITYETYYDTTIHNIPNFNLDSTRLTRANPVGPYEKFTIKFNHSDGTSSSDYIINNATYGGIVLIEDDVFAATVLQNCFDTPSDIESYYFVDACYVCDVDLACKFSTEYLEEINIYEEEPAVILENINLAEYKQAMIDSVLNAFTASDPDVSDCVDVFPDEQNARFAVIGTSKDEFSIYPNPFSDRLLIQPKEIDSKVEYEITITGIHGKKVYAKSHVFDPSSEKLAINTKHWAPGMYVITMLHGDSRETRKVIKR